MKRIISFILSVLIALSIIAVTPVTVMAEDDVNSGKAGDLYWSHDKSSHVLTISGKGKMLDYENPEIAFLENENPAVSPWLDMSRALRTANISEGVTSIGDNAFAYCFYLESITIPDTVTSIGDGAFYWCEELSSVTIPDSVTSIGDIAFFYCHNNNLSITIPSSVTSIGDAAFSFSDKLELTVDPDSQYFYADDSGALIGKKNSKLLYYPMNNRQTHYTIPNGVTSIGDYAFAGNSSLESITIPDSVTSIGKSAFNGCSGLKSITIPSSVTSIAGWSVDNGYWGSFGPFPDSITTIYVAPDSCGEKWIKQKKEWGEYKDTKIKTFSDKLTITSAKSSSAGIIEISWSDIGADSYIVYIAEGNSNSYKKCDKFNGTSAKLDKFGNGEKAVKLESGKTYKLRVVRSDYTGKLSEALGKCPSVKVKVK